MTINLNFWNKHDATEQIHMIVDDLNRTYQNKMYSLVVFPDISRVILNSCIQITKPPKRSPKFNLSELRLSTTKAKLKRKRVSYKSLSIPKELSLVR